MFINAIQEIFSHAFMVRALITGLFISVTPLSWGSAWC